MQRPSSLFKLLPCAALVICSVALAEQADPLADLLVNEYSRSVPAASTDGPLGGAPQSSTSPIAETTRTQIAKTLDLIARPDDIWVRIRNGFAIPNIDTSLVTEKQAWFLSHGDSLQRTITRSSRYLYHVVEELEKRGMPTELALLPFIESAYNPMAYSSANASGMWQFIPSTGKSYNLKQNWWQDERRDVIASTDAALTYLQTIYEMHGDWHLALASYNWGENAVKRAIEKNEAAGLRADYLSLKMPDETRNYVPKLQALKNIIANPDLYGITLPKIENEPYFAAINNIKGMDVMTAARLAEMPLDEFKALNPSFNRPVIPGFSDVTLLLPADRVETFEINLLNSTQPLVTWQAYTPKKGETLSKVAKRFGMKLAYLLQVNGLNPKSRVKTGTTLLVQSTSPGKDQNGFALINSMQTPVITYNTKTSTKTLVSKKMITPVSKKITVKNNNSNIKLAVKKSSPALKKLTGTKSTSKLASETKRRVS